MAITVDLCTDADIDRVFHIISDAFKHTQPYIDAVFPQHDTPAGHAQACDRLLEIKRTEPTACFIKAVDSHTGQIVGQAIWLILDKDPGEERLEGNFWENEHEEDFAQELFAQFMVPRTEAFRSAHGQLLVLDILSVDPNSQSTGAGSMLTRWGVELADRVGLAAVVESTMNAVHVYEKNGFQASKKMDFNFSEKFVERPKPQLQFMHRPAKQRDA